MRETPVVGAVVDAAWVAGQSLARTDTKTHIDGTVLEGQEQMGAFVELSSSFLPSPVTAMKIGGGVLLTTGLIKIPKSWVGAKVLGDASKGTLLSSVIATKVLNHFGLNKTIPPTWTPWLVKSSNLSSLIGRWTAPAGAGLLGGGYLLDEYGNKK